MGEKCHSICPTECSIAPTIANSRGTLPYALHRYLHIDFLLLVCDTSLLAITDTVLDLLYLIKGIDFWDNEPSFRVSAIFASVVTVCFLLPSQTPPESRASSDQEIHFWISSAWNYINGGICSILN